MMHSASYDVYVATYETVYSAVLSADQTYLATVNFNTMTVVYKKALARLE